MQGKRSDRIAHLIQMELSQLILHRVKDPRLGFVTVTHVKITPDLKSARVYYSAMGNEAQKTDTRIALDKASGFLQRQVGSVLQLRYTPRLTFVLDDSFDRGQEIDKVLFKLHKEQKTLEKDEDSAK